MRQISKDLTAGIFLLGIAALAFFQGASLEMGTLRQIGPGLLPRGLAVLLGSFGVALVLKGYTERSPRGRQPAEPHAPEAAEAPGSPSSSWKRALRGPTCLFAAVCLFGLGVRTVGFLIAGPLVVMVSALASEETRWGENVIFAGAMTAFCFILFKTLLSLPIPVAPWILGY
jgi:hypothetical protein